MHSSIENLTNCDAVKLSQIIQSREISVLDVVKAYLQKMENLNQKYNAIVTIDAENALAKARAADRALSTGQLWGPLHGVPVTVKDSFATAGIRTTAGYEKYKNYIPDNDAAAVEKLKQAGVIVVGKTNCAKLCCDIQTSNKLYGTTVNPWNTECTSGGSSGGEAVAVALGMSALGIGSDTGGSIRIPSSYCGVYGFKPSLATISRSGHIPPLLNSNNIWEDSLTVVGPIARSVRDIILCYQILSGERNINTLPDRSPRIAWSNKLSTQIVDDSIATCIETTFNRIGNSANECTLIEVDSPLSFREAIKKYVYLFMYEFYPKEAGSLQYRLFWFSEYMRSLFKGGVRERHSQLKQYQLELAERFDRFMTDYDCWALPATPTVAVAHRKPWQSIPVVEKGKTVRVGYLAGISSLMFPFSMIGNPSIVLPIGKDDRGMPIAIQLVGKKGEDAKLLELASYVDGLIRDVNGVNKPKSSYGDTDD